MELPRYKFNSNNEYDLLSFLKAATRKKNNSMCNTQEYERLKVFFPLNKDLKLKLADSTDNIDAYIDLTIQEEIEQKTFLEIDDNIIKDEISNMLTNSNVLMKENNTDAIIEILKDILLTKDEIPSSVLNDLTRITREQLERIFGALEDLNLEQVERIWCGIQNHEFSYENVLPSYVKLLYLPKIKDEYKQDICNIFEILTVKHSNIFRKELLQEIFNKGLSEVIIRYLEATSNEFKTNLLRDYASSADKLETYHIPIIEVLINPQIDNNIHGKLIEHLSNAAHDFTRDNTYGKLLFTIVNSMKSYIPHLEQVLKHILGVHQSIWKIKVQKVVFNNLDDTLTQSLR